jgi:acyl-CoA thioesterase
MAGSGTIAAMDTGFSQVLASIGRTSGGSFTVIVPPDWLQGRTVFGGLQMALGTRAMRAVLPLQAAALPLRSAQMTFVGPLLGGQPIRLHAEALRVGKSTVHARCDLRHDEGGLACTVVAIFGGPRESHFVKEMPQPDPGCTADEVDGTPFSAAPAFLQHFEMRIAQGAWPYSGHHEPRSMIYARLRDRDCGSEDAVLALADVIPTPVLSTLKVPAPASSVNWMIELLRDPAYLDLHDWVLIDTEVRAGTAGYLSQTSVLHGADGHAYAVSHQTVAVFG